MGRMVFGLRKKIDAAEFGEGLLVLLARAVDAEPSPEPLLAQPSPQALRREIAYLVAWTIDYAVWFHANEEQLRKKILDAYCDGLKRGFGRGDGDLGTLDGFANRSLEYAGAVEHPIQTADPESSAMKDNLPWTVGRTFAGACGDSKDMALIMWAAGSFTGMVQAVSQLFRKWRPV